MEIDKDYLMLVLIQAGSEVEVVPLVVAVASLFSTQKIQTNKT